MDFNRILHQEKFLVDQLRFSDSLDLESLCYSLLVSIDKTKINGMIFGRSLLQSQAAILDVFQHQKVLFYSFSTLSPYLA